MLNLTTNKILQHLQDDNSLAIVSPFRTENSIQENNKLLRELKAKVRSMNLGFSELKSKWVEIDPSSNEQISSDERALMIYGMSSTLLLPITASRRVTFLRIKLLLCHQR